MATDNLTPEEIQAYRQRYTEYGHAVQSGVAMIQNWDPETPKGLRTGINITFTDHSSLVTLLMSKGIITEREYYEALIEGMVKEVRRLEDEIQEHLGGNGNSPEVHLA